MGNRISSIGVEKDKREIILISYLISEWLNFFYSPGPDEKIKSEQKIQTVQWKQNSDNSN